MRTLLKVILKLLARATLRRYQPRVVGVTGSVGKTSTKEAVAAVLAARGSVGTAHKNLNNEIGLPLAILGAHDSGYRNPFAWFSIIARAVAQLITPSSTYPATLVLEYGIDHRGDMDYLLSLAQPDVAVVTAVGETHLEFMGTVEQVAREKGKLVAALSPTGTAVLNADDALAVSTGKRTKARVVTFGLSPSADVRADGVALSRGDDGQVRGVSFKLLSGGSSVPVLLVGVVGSPPVLAALAAAAVGLSLGMTALEVGDALRTVVFPPGRLRLLPGIKGTTLLDDTYNASPRATMEALQALGSLPRPADARRWAILGDMLELGQDSELLHQGVGERVVAACDYLVTVGERSRDIARGAASAGFGPDHATHFARAEEAARFVQDKLKPGDVVLIKGSQGVRCERATKELMAEPGRARELLVRQYKPWI